MDGTLCKQCVCAWGGETSVHNWVSKINVELFIQKASKLYNILQTVTLFLYVITVIGKCYHGHFSTCISEVKRVSLIIWVASHDC